MSEKCLALLWFQYRPLILSRGANRHHKEDKMPFVDHWTCVMLRVVSLNAQQAELGVHLVDPTRACFIVNEYTTRCSCSYHTCFFKMHNVYSFMRLKMYLFSFQNWELILQFVSRGMMKLDKTICYNWCAIAMKWLLWLQQVVAVLVPLWCHTLR